MSFALPFQPSGATPGQLPCLDFGYHSAIKRFRGFLFGPRPTTFAGSVAPRALLIYDAH